MIDNKTICSAFWVHTNIRPDDRIFPCCRYKNSIQKFSGDVGEILNSKIYHQLRNDSVNGEKNSNCEKCYHEEKLGKKSLRQWFNENYSIDLIELKYLEVGFDNICNLTCDGCWEEWSSSWWSRKNPDKRTIIGILDTKDFTNVPNTIKKIVFLGGEPLMTNRHRKFLQKIENLKDISVEYFTNGMFELSDKDKAILDQCKNVKFNISIDGYGTLNENVRKGSEWDKVEFFAQQLKYPKTIHTVIHKNNWRGLPDMKKWIDDNGFLWTTNILTYPKDLDITNLSLDEKKELISIVDSYKIPNNDYVKSYLNL